MGIYAGVDGVVREVQNMEVGRSYVVRHSQIWKAGVDGVVRDLMPLTDQIDHILVAPTYIYTYTINSSGEYVSTDGYDLETATKYGSVTIDTTNKYVQVQCTTALKEILLLSSIYVVYKDGHRSGFYDVINKETDNGFSMKVTAYEYFSTTGWYYSYCLGQPVKSDYVSGSETTTATITTASGYYSEVMAALRYSGTVRSRQTFTTITINGISFPVKISNELS